MRILGLIGSPRKLGNSEILVKEMLSIFPQEAEKKIIRLTDLVVKNCSACYICLASEKSCIIQDDLNFLLDQIRLADVIVIAAPCYFLGTHTSIKAIGDRLISILQNGSEFAGKKCVTVVTYGVPEWDGFARESLISFARFLHLEVVGDMVVQAASPGEVIRSEVIEQAHALIKRILDKDIPSPMSSNILCCPVCTSRLLEIGDQGNLRCVLCGSQGKLVKEGPEYTVIMEPSAHNRFSPEGMAAHGKVLEQIKDDYIRNRHELSRIRKSYECYNEWFLAPNSK